MQFFKKINKNIVNKKTKKIQAFIFLFLCYNIDINKRRYKYMNYKKEIRSNIIDACIMGVCGIVAVAFFYDVIWALIIGIVALILAGFDVVKVVLDYQRKVKPYIALRDKQSKTPLEGLALMLVEDQLIEKLIDSSDNFIDISGHVDYTDLSNILMEVYYKAVTLHFTINDVNINIKHEVKDKCFKVLEPNSDDYNTLFAYTTGILDYSIDDYTNADEIVDKLIYLIAEEQKQIDALGTVVSLGRSKNKNEIES